MIKKPRIIKFEIHSNLTPFHEKVMLDCLYAMMDGLDYYWNNHSKKGLKIICHQKTKKT